MADESAPKTRGRTISWARFYDAIVVFMSLGQERKIREMTLDLAGLKPGETVLDVGCGTGTLTLLAKSKVGPEGAVYGIDPAPQMIAVARRKAAQAKSDVDLRVGLIEDIPYPDDHFDLVLSSLMLHHLPDDLKRQGFAEIYRVLKAGGRFLAVDFEPPANPVVRHLVMLPLGHANMPSNIGQTPPMLTEAGFTDVQVGVTRYQVLSFARGFK